MKTRGLQFAWDLIERRKPWERGWAPFWPQRTPLGKEIQLRKVLSFDLSEIVNLFLTLYRTVPQSASQFALIWSSTSLHPFPAVQVVFLGDVRNICR